MKTAVPIRTIFFDLDGTLTNILKRETYAIHDTVNHFGLRISREEVRSLLYEVSKGWREVRSYSDIFDILGVELNDRVTEYWTSAFLKRYRLSILRKGTKSTLKLLSGRFTLFCVTSRETLAEVKMELEFLGLDEFFDQIVTRGVAAEHFGLPSIPLLPFQEQRKMLYECALVIADCPRDQVLVIGDMASELKPAKEIGMATLGLLTDKGKEADLRKVSDRLISNITQLKTILARPSLR
jgi:phosphoglycolate phosphatase-like HAD superfamily hydrolase